METTLGEIAATGYEPLVKDGMTEKLAPKIKRLAALLSEAKAKNRFILLRFHHDADGISGAFALMGVLRFQPYQQNAAVYSVKDAIRDLSNIQHEDKPLVILLDFGMNQESEEGLGLLRAGGAEVIVIDHHPPSASAMGRADFFLTPWEFSGDESASRYVAGYLAAEVARACGSDAKAYAKIACAGDKSGILELDDEDRKKALVLDYLAAHSGFGNNLRFYRNVLSNPELFDSMFRQADEKINEAADKAMRAMKERKQGDVSVYLVGLEKVVRKGEFPNRSKVTTRVFDRLKENTPGPLVVLGIGERTIIMRLDQAAADRGLGADKLAKKMLETMRDFTESGGGHAKAGAIRVKEGFANAVVDEIVKLVASA